MPAIHAARRSALRHAISAAGVEAILITDLLNVCYLTGFTGSNAALVVSADSAESEDGTRFCTDGRYLTQSAQQVPDLERVIDRPCDVALVRGLPGRLGFEADSVTVAGLTTLEEAADAELVALSGIVELLRAIKDPGEIEDLRQACAVADQAFEDLLAAGGVKVGRTEREVSLDLDERMRRLGAADPAFETIVAAGPNSAIPHHRPTAAVLSPGDFVKFDFGARVAGYHSDMTRTVVLGEPADWQREIYQVVAAAQAAGREASMPGAVCSDVDGAARTVIAEAGYGKYFLHGLGHGIGLQIHEAPSVGSVSSGIMAPDMVVTVEPGIYLQGRGGVRIEDSGVIRPEGYELLTLTTKELLVL